MVWFSCVMVAGAWPTPGVLPEIEDPHGHLLDEELEWPVVGGEPAPPGNDDVVGLAFYDESSQLVDTFCTGSVIQDDWILTAAHCIDQSNGFAGAGLQRVAVWGDDIRAEGPTELIPWAEALVSPTYDEASFTGDIGLVRLERPHPDPTWVVLRDEPFGTDQVGASLEVFGFGATGDGRADSGVKRTTQLPIEEVDASNIITFTPDRNVCSGDSGGPGFVEQPWGREQVGINAFVTPGCIGGRGGSTRVDVNIAWILENVPGVATDPAELPRDEPDEPGGDRDLLDLGVGDRQAFAVGFGDVEPAPGQGCSSAPASLAVATWLPLLALVRRRSARSASHAASPEAPPAE